MATLYTAGQRRRPTDTRFNAEPAARRRSAETPAALVGGRTLNALAANPYSGTSQLSIEFVYDHYNPGPGGPRFSASNNLAAPPNSSARPAAS